MEKRYDVIAALDTCVDLVVELGDTTPEFNQKEKWVPSYHMELGGSNAIFACQCAKLGLKTMGSGVVGGDAFGKIVLNGLEKAGVNVSHVETNPHVSTGLGVLLNRGGDRAILTCAGTIGITGAEYLCDELLSKARHLHIGSYYLMTALRKKLPDIVCRAKKLNLSVSLDTNWDPEEKWELPRDLLSLVDIFFPNENEAYLLTGINDPKAAALSLAKQVPEVVVKLGAKGAISVSKDGFEQAPAFPVEVTDTVGAGDSFDGGYLYGYLNGLSGKERLLAGVFCGSMNTRGSGGVASQASISELQQYMKSLE